MTNHPNRSKSRQTDMVAKILRRYSLERIELICTERSVTARAYPTGWHPIVAERRRQAFAALPSGTKLSVYEATEISTNAYETPIVQVSAEGIDEVLIALNKALATCLASYLAEPTS